MNGHAHLLYALNIAVRTAMSVDNLEGIVTHERRASILRRKFTPPSLSHG
ncbi:hypothetical protein ACSLPB_27390 [Escherichia coli]